MVWSSDGRSAKLEVPSRAFGVERPLADQTRYGVDLRDWRSARGGAVDPSRGLDEGLLRFTTGSYDALLNHSCGHVRYGPFAEVAASASPVGAPDLGRTHTHYTVALPRAGAGYAGHVRARFAAAGPHRLYFAAPVDVQEGNDVDGGVALPSLATPAACEGIRYATDVIAPAVGSEVRWLFRASTSPVAVIVEAMDP